MQKLKESKRQHFNLQMAAQQQVHSLTAPKQKGKSSQYMDSHNDFFSHQTENGPIIGFRPHQIYKSQNHHSSKVANIKEVNHAFMHN